MGRRSQKTAAAEHRDIAPNRTHGDHAARHQYKAQCLHSPKRANRGCRADGHTPATIRSSHRLHTNDQTRFKGPVGGLSENTFC
ncbi:Hypothetical predicted protein [Pelobates cultripes]|uniref:Uncharacterized protein n=1 Tax=Pelobates cultripes TaxID=61616 RepID=A0AAD1SDI8_PELCU|nr:Hypothetical predicted protein [Pelobates cultripes]